MTDTLRASFGLGSSLWSRRRVLGAGAALVLAGCGDAPVYSSIGDMVRLATVGLPDQPIERSAVAKLPYATISAKIGKGPRGLMALAQISADELRWLSSDRISLVTEGGRLVKTAGLPENLRDTQLLGPDPVNKTLHRLAQPVAFDRAVDFDTSRRFGVPIHSRFDSLGAKKITIVEIEFDTVLVRETNVAKTVNWTFENYYWVDAIDGFVWKSIQHIWRDFPPVDMEVLKPAAV